MKIIIFFTILATVANAKPNLRNPKIQFADGKIIGGQEAPKRNYIKSLTFEII